MSKLATTIAVTTQKQQIKQIIVFLLHLHSPVIKPPFLGRWSPGRATESTLEDRGPDVERLESLGRSTVDSNAPEVLDLLELELEKAPEELGSSSLTAILRSWSSRKTRH
jgi:hypothetical protein